MPNSLFRRVGMVADSSNKGTNGVFLYAKRMHKRTPWFQKTLGRRKFQSVTKKRLHMQAKQVFSPGAPNGMKTLWPCIGLSGSNQCHPPAHGTTLTLDSPVWGYKQAAAQAQGGSDSKCIERATSPHAFHRDSGKGKEWVKETGLGGAGRRHTLAAC